MKRLAAERDAQPAKTIEELLQDRHVDEELRSKILRLETQKRVAYDSEDYAKATEIRGKVGVRGVPPGLEGSLAAAIASTYNIGEPLGMREILG